MTYKNEEYEQILKFYNDGAEIGRLQRGIGKIEYERTLDILKRHLPTKKQVVYDVGGGIGVYSSWLANLGHEVHLLEFAPNAVEYAKQRNISCDHPIDKIEVADARQLNREDESADIVLLMGPLYHLTEKKERLKALKEASRVLKKGGLLIVTAISRFSTSLWGLSTFGEKNEFIDDDEFFGMIEQELIDGQHIRAEKFKNFIVRAFFHTPIELKEEIEVSGLSHEKTIAIEGPVWIVPTFEEKWDKPKSKQKLLQICSLVEEQESLLGMSPHILAVAKKSENIVIRQAKIEDLQQVANVLNEVTLHLQAKEINQWNYPWDVNIVSDQIKNNNQYVLLHNEKIIGTFSISEIDQLSQLEIKPGSKYLSKIAILPEFQGQNLGSYVIKFAFSFAEQGNKTLYLDCWAGNEKLKSFYTKAGLQYIGDFPEEDYFISIFKYHNMKQRES